MFTEKQAELEFKWLANVFGIFQQVFEICAPNMTQFTHKMVKMSLNLARKARLNKKKTL